MATTVWLALTLWLVMMIGELGVVTQSVRPLARLAYVSPGSKSSSFTVQLALLSILLAKDPFGTPSLHVPMQSLLLSHDQLTWHTVVTLH